jgi:hypothetical protein
MAWKSVERVDPGNPIAEDSRGGETRSFGDGYVSSMLALSEVESLEEDNEESCFLMLFLWPTRHEPTPTVRTNGMMPSLNSHSRSLVWPTDLCSSTTWCTLSNMWDIRALKVLSFTSIHSWERDERLNYGMFLTRRVYYGQIKVDRKDDILLRCQPIPAMLDTSTNTLYKLPEPPQYAQYSHLTRGGEYIHSPAWEIMYYLLKPFVEEEICNMVRATHEDLRLLEDYPDYYSHCYNVKHHTKRKREHYYPMHAKAYNGQMYYDERIDNLTPGDDSDDANASFLEYQRIHFAVAELAGAHDYYLSHSHDFDYDVFQLFSRRMFN